MDRPNIIEELTIGGRWPRRLNRKAPERFTFPPGWKCTDDNSDDNDEFDPDGDSDVTSVNSETQTAATSTEATDVTWLEIDSTADSDSETSWAPTSEESENSSNGPPSPMTWNDPAPSMFPWRSEWITEYSLKKGFPFKLGKAFKTE